MTSTHLLLSTAALLVVTGLWLLAMATRPVEAVRSRPSRRKPAARWLPITGLVMVTVVALGVGVVPPASAAPGPNSTQPAGGGQGKTPLTPQQLADAKRQILDALDLAERARDFRDQLFQQEQQALDALAAATTDTDRARYSSLAVAVRAMRSEFEAAMRTALRANLPDTLRRAVRDLMPGAGVGATNPVMDALKVANAIQQMAGSTFGKRSQLQSRYDAAAKELAQAQGPIVRRPLSSMRKDPRKAQEITRLTAAKDAAKQALDNYDDGLIKQAVQSANDPQAAKNKLTSEINAAKADQFPLSQSKSARPIDDLRQIVTRNGPPATPSVSAVRTPTSDLTSDPLTAQKLGQYLSDGYAVTKDPGGSWRFTVSYLNPLGNAAPGLVSKITSILTGQEQTTITWSGEKFLAVKDGVTRQITVRYVDSQSSSGSAVNKVAPQLPQAKLPLKSPPVPLAPGLTFSANASVSASLIYSGSQDKGQTTRQTQIRETETVTPPGQASGLPRPEVTDGTYALVPAPGSSGNTMAGVTAKVSALGGGTLTYQPIHGGPEVQVDVVFSGEVSAVAKAQDTLTQATTLDEFTSALQAAQGQWAKADSKISASFTVSLTPNPGAPDVSGNKVVIMSVSGERSFPTLAAKLNDLIKGLGSLTRGKLPLSFDDIATTVEGSLAPPGTSGARPPAQQTLALPSPSTPPQAPPTPPSASGQTPPATNADQQPGQSQAGVLAPPPGATTVQQPTSEIATLQPGVTVVGPDGNASVIRTPTQVTLPAGSTAAASSPGQNVAENSTGTATLPAGTTVAGADGMPMTVANTTTVELGTTTPQMGGDQHQGTDAVSSDGSNVPTLPDQTNIADRRSSGSGAQSGLIEPAPAQQTDGTDQSGTPAGQDVTTPTQQGDQCNCFPAGTLVATARGQVPIEDIRIGDQVWAHDLTTGHTELRLVTALFRRQATALLTLDVAGVQVQVTPDHLFWVPGHGWVPAGQLRSGDLLQRRDGSAPQVRAATSRAVDTTVYNFTVAGDHDYYISDAQLLVHNCDVPGSNQQYFVDSNGSGGLQPMESVNPSATDTTTGNALRSSNTVEGQYVVDEAGQAHIVFDPNGPRVVGQGQELGPVESPDSTVVSDLAQPSEATQLSSEVEGVAGLGAGAITDAMAEGVISSHDPSKYVMDMVHDYVLMQQWAATNKYDDRIQQMQNNINWTIAHGGPNSGEMALMYARLAQDPQAQAIVTRNCGSDSRCVASQTSAWNAKFQQAQTQELVNETLQYGSDPQAIAKPILNSTDGSVQDVINTRTGQPDEYLKLVYEYRKNLPAATADQVVSQVNQLTTQLSQWGVPVGQITPENVAAAISTLQTRTNATDLYSNTASHDTSAYKYDRSQTWLQNYLNLQGKITTDTDNAINQGVRTNAIGEQHGVEATGPVYGTTSDFSKGMQSSDAMRQTAVGAQLLTGLQLSQQGDVNSYAVDRGNAAAIAKLKSEGYDVRLSTDGKSYSVDLKSGQSGATVQKQFTQTAQDTYDNTQNTFENNYLTALLQIKPLPGETKSEYAGRIHDAAIGMTKDNKPVSSYQPDPVYVKSNADNNTNGPDTVQPGDTYDVQKRVAGDLAQKTGDNNPMYTIDKGARDDPNPVGNVDAPSYRPTASDPGTGNTTHTADNNGVNSNGHSSGGGKQNSDAGIGNTPTHTVDKGARDDSSPVGNVPDSQTTKNGNSSSGHGSGSGGGSSSSHGSSSGSGSSQGKSNSDAGIGNTPTHTVDKGARDDSSPVGNVSNSQTAKNNTNNSSGSSSSHNTGGSSTGGSSTGGSGAKSTPASSGQQSSSVKANTQRLISLNQ